MIVVLVYRSIALRMILFDSNSFRPQYSLYYDGISCIAVYKKAYVDPVKLNRVNRLSTCILEFLSETFYG